MKVLKIISFILLFSVFASLLSSTVYAKEGECAWFCKRCGKYQPPITEEETLISSYSGYSIDRSVNDSSDNKIIYLTFDLGYENGNTKKVLEALRKEKVPAAFFILDNILLRNLDLVNEMINDGHLICNHTKNHKNLSNASIDEIFRKMFKC